jgi:hypothetical protein
MNGLRFGLFLLALSSFACSGSSATGSGSSSSGSPGKADDGSGPAGGSGTGSGSAGDALFQTPADTSATPDSIFGLWGGSLDNEGFTFDTRVKLASDAMTFAQRCTDDSNGAQGGVASVVAKARVSNDDVTCLESKNDEQKVGSITCRAATTVGDTKRCAPEDKGFESNCFELDGTSLTIFGATSFDKLVLTKISD